MSQTAIELRKAAASARAFAESLQSAELKRSFREMAGRWEKEADDSDTAELHSRRSTQAPRKH